MTYQIIFFSYQNKGSRMNNNTYISEFIKEDLDKRYPKSVLNKKELANELGMSVSSINTYICKGEGIPEYIKVGNSRNGMVLFPKINVISYLSNTIKVA